MSRKVPPPPPPPPPLPLEDVEVFPRKENGAAAVAGNVLQAVRDYDRMMRRRAAAGMRRAKEVYKALPPDKRPLAAAGSLCALALVLRLARGVFGGRRKRGKQGGRSDEKPASRYQPQQPQQTQTLQQQLSPARATPSSASLAQRAPQRVLRGSEALTMEAVQAELARLPRAEVADTREHVSRALCLYAGLMLREQGPQRSQALLLRLRWLQAVLSSGGLSVLLRETERHASAGGGGSATMELLVLASTLRRSATALRGARPEAALPGQLLGRLGLTKSRELPPGLAALVAEAAAWRDAVTLLRPISASLDAPGGALETVLEGHTDTVTALSPAFDGCIASASRDGTLRIWRLWECACEHVLTGHSGLVRAVVLMPGGLLISGGTDCTLRVWDTHSGICNGVIRCQRKVVAMAALSGSDVAVALDDNALRIWSVATRSTSGHVLAAHSDSITSIVLISTFVIASGGLDGLINVWTVMAGTGTLDRTIQAGGKVCSLAALPEGRIASAHLDCTRVWTATGMLAINIPCGKTNRVAALPDGRFATAHDGKIQVWAPDGSLLRSVKGRRAAAVELQGLADGRIVSGALDGAVRLWASALSGATQSAREGLPASPSLARGAAACHTDRVSAMVTLVESGRVVTASWDSTLRLWDPATGSCVGVLKGHTNRVTVLRALSTGNLLSASVDSCRLWSGRTGSLEHTLLGHTRPVADAAEVCGRPVTASEDGTLRSWSPVSGTAACVFQGHADRVNACIAVSDDRLVSGSADRTLRLWHAQSGKCLAVLRGHSEGVNCLALLHEGLAVSGSDDHAIAIWNLSNGTCELIMKGGSEPIRSLTLLGDGRVASVGSKETLKIWNVDECLCEHTEHGAFAGTVTPLAASAAGGGVGCFAYAQGSFLATSFGTARFYADDPVRAVTSSTTAEGTTVLAVGTDQGAVHFVAVELNSQEMLQRGEEDASSHQGTSMA